MNTGTTLTVALIALAAGGFAGYRLAQPKHDGGEPMAAVDGQKGPKNLHYYRNPMGLPDTSPVPKKDPMGMDYLPVYEGEAGFMDMMSFCDWFFLYVWKCVLYGSRRSNMN